MIILRQKEFISTKLKVAAKLTRAGRDAKFAGSYIGGTIGRAGKTLGSSVAHPVRTLKGVGKGVVQDNIEAVKWVGNAGNTILNPNSGASAGQRVTTAVKTAMDFTPGTAAVTAIGDKANQIAGKSGKDFVRSMAELRYNPVKKVGEEAAIMRTSQGYGRFKGRVGKIGGGTWTKGGVNNACLGTAPDRVVYHVGDTWQKAQGGNVEREIEAFVNSKQGRRMARAYDKKVASTLNPIHKSVEGLSNSSEGAINSGWGKVKSFFRLKPQLAIT